MLTRTHLRLGLATATAAALTGGLLGLSTGTATAATPAKPAPAKYADDFNGDGFRDFASVESSDTVTVTYGTVTGPGSRTTSFTQDSPGIPGDRTGSDGFTRAMATADFNSDGYADLAVSDAHEKVGKHKARGLVVIVWGSKSGLGPKATTLAVTSPYADQNFGMSLAAGDFDGNGKPDLAVMDSESVHIYRGGFSSKDGGTRQVTRHKPGSDIWLNPMGLVAGQITKDRATDLYVLGQGSKEDSDQAWAWFLRGGSTMKSGKRTTYNSAIQGHSGPSSVIADFDKDGYGDLALGDYQHKDFAGSVFVLRGAANGPGSSYRLTQGTPGIATGTRTMDVFGISLSAGDTNRDGYPDLAVGTAETIGSAEGAGGVHVLHGSKKGLTGAGSQWITRATPGIPGDPETAEGFGSDIRLRDVNRDDTADLLISSSGSYKSLLIEGGSTVLATGRYTEPFLRANFPQ
ncbi:FG-GAP repeat protein [Streptomyces amakusaensis]|uniref:FG-GAP and VCBS repeat-containing protein n=1 Tax=Streptomyces amakusaensis TaxID=67271 RepID=A0ABW0ANJ6_9ACTN